MVRRVEEEKAETLVGREVVRGEVVEDQRERRPTALKPAPWKEVGAAVPERTEAERTAVRADALVEAAAARREAARRRREEAFICFVFFFFLKYPPIIPR